MTAPAIAPDYWPDLLAQLDENARLSLTTAGRVREAWLRAVQAVSDRDGDFGSGRVRAWLDANGYEWAHGNESGSTITALVRGSRPAAVWTGRRELLGNTAQRAGSRDVKVYRLTRQVFPEVTA